VKNAPKYIDKIAEKFITDVITAYIVPSKFFGHNLDEITNNGNMLSSPMT
jgi:hypothetical protein